MGELTLYDYYRSSSSYRVRIALNVKGLSYHRVAVNLREAEQYGADYRQVNPQGLVPTLAVDDEYISQSLAMIEWLEERYPQPPLLPGNPFDRAIIRSLSHAVAMDIQPLNNLRVLEYFRGRRGWDERAVTEWYRHWIATGFSAIEAQLRALRSDGRHCFSDGVTLADICLVPQVYNAKRFDCDLTDFPLIRSVDKHCNTLRAFADAAPEALE